MVTKIVVKNYTHQRCQGPVGALARYLTPVGIYRQPLQTQQTHSDRPSHINVSPAALYCSAVKENKVIISLSPLPSNSK